MAACIVLVFSFTPAGTSTWAKAREAFMGIGQYLGNSAEDDYVSVIDQTQKKGDITFTLNEVVASDYQMRFSVTVEKDDGTIVRLRDVGLHTPLYINGLKIGGTGISDIEGYGVGPYGSKRDGNRGIYFESITYSYDMPLYPEIKASFYAEDQRFDFEFTIDNKKFKEATKEVEEKTYNMKAELLKEQTEYLKSKRMEGHIYEMSENNGDRAWLFDITSGSNEGVEEIDFDIDLLKTSKEGDLFIYKNGKYQKYQ